MTRAQRTVTVRTFLMAAWCFAANPAFTQTITFDAFRQEWTGRYINYPGGYGGQCMDLMHQYTSEVLGFDALHAATAYDAWLNGDSRFDRIINTPTGVPQKGDLVFWNTSVGSAGHVAVFIEGDVSRFSSFDQNWPIGSAAHVQPHNYSGVAGWLHPKITQPTSDPDVTSLANQARAVGWYFFTGASGRWYIANAGGSVLALESSPGFPAGGTLPWKPISNYSTPYAGFPGAGVNYSYVRISADGRSVSFGSLQGGGGDPEVAQLANTTQPVKWMYFQDSRQVWYIFELYYGSQAVMRLMGYDPTVNGNVLWKPINNYGAFLSYPAAGVVYQYISLSSDGTTLYFGPLK